MKYLLALIALLPLFANAQIITTIAGTGESGFSGDYGHATAAKLARPHGVSADINGNIYISDMNNNRIRKIDANGIIQPYAG